MSAGSQVFVAWEERIICPEKGKRVVHFYLKGSSANSILAVVGTERSIRHMIYVITEDFVDSYGIVRAGTKWRARREVVEWLTKLVSGFRQPSAISNFQAIELTQSLGSPKLLMSGFENMQSNGVDQTQVCRKFKVQSSAIEWLGEAWICPKQLKHYPAFLSNGRMIAVHSFVFIMHGEEESHYLGYLEDLYEDTEGAKKVEVRWFCHSQEVKEVIPQLNAHPEEVFITPDIQVIGAEYIDQVGAVLSPNHYEKCLAFLPDNLSSGIFLCHREFKNKKVKPVSLSKLRGYDNQTILSSLDCHHDSNNKAKLQKWNKEKEDFPYEDHAKLVTRRIRNRRGYQKKEGGRSGTSNLILENQREKYEQQKLKLKLSKRPGGIKLVGSKQSQSSSKDEKNIELLCQDSGIRGCWFRCKILQISQNRIKVQHYDVQDAGGPGKLEEWVPAFRAADPDKLNMRCAGRLTVRPWPPQTLDYSFEIGDAVDAWWCDGWWECVVTGFDISGSDSVQVYLPGDNKFMSFQRKDLRTSRDWINDKWIEIKAKPDIHSFIASTIDPDRKVSKHSTSTEASKHAGSKLADDKKLKSSKPEALKDDVQKLPGSVTSTELKVVDHFNLKKRLLISDSKSLVDRDSVKSSEGSHRGKAKSDSMNKFDRRLKMERKSKQSSG